MFIWHTSVDYRSIFQMQINIFFNFYLLFLREHAGIGKVRKKCENSDTVIFDARHCED